MGVSRGAARAIAEAGYVFLFPLVASYRTLYTEAIDPSSPTFGGGFHRWIHDRHAASRETDVSSSHLTTLVSRVWLDLRADPIVLSTPAVDAPLVLGITDLWGHAVDVASGTTCDADSIVVASLDWVGAVPDDVDHLARCETSFGRCVTRVQLSDPGDLEFARRIQGGHRIEPLSAWTDRPPATPAPPIVWWPTSDAVLTSTEFWSVASFALTLTTPDEQDRGILDRLAEIGVGPGNRFDDADLPPDTATAIGEGMDDALTQLMRAAVDAGDPTPAGSRAGNDRDYFARALVAIRTMPAPDTAVP